MKNILSTLLLTMVSVFVSAQSFFKDGMVWKSSLWATPESPIFTEKTYLNGTETVDGHEALKMYCYTEGYGEPEMFAYIRIDGGKVYFKKSGVATADWLLAYDFGMKPDEGNYFWSFKYDEDGLPLKSYAKCRKVEENVESGFATMTIDEYSDESCKDYLSTCIWLKGLSSIGGIKQNLNFGIDGGFERLLEVSYKGEVIYNDATLSVASNVSEGVSVRREGEWLNVRNAKKGSMVAVYTADGVLLGHMVAEGAMTRMALPRTGLLVVKVNGKVLKVN